jgi:hypothetical protein
MLFTPGSRDQDSQESPQDSSLGLHVFTPCGEPQGVRAQEASPEACLREDPDRPQGPGLGLEREPTDRPPFDI